MKRFKLSGQKSNFEISTEISKKIYVTGFFVIILTLLHYQLINGDYYSQRAKNNYVRVIPLRAIRGSISDRTGEVLAFDRAVFNISVIPYQIRNKKDRLFARIAEFLNCDISLLQGNYRRHLHNVFSPVDVIRDVDKAVALRLKEAFDDDILINPQPRRYYPYPYQTAHIVGYVKKAAAHYEKLKKYGYKPLERVGFVGVEQYYDAYLKGEDGGDLIEVDATGNVVGFLGEQRHKRGKDIQLTIDYRIQREARQSLGEKIGVIILMDSHSGGMIAFYSSPAFNTNNFIQGKRIERFLRSKGSPLINRGIQARYAIGSVFKPILAIAALEERKTTPYSSFICQGHIQLGISKFRCSGVHGNQDLRQALIHSCNVYFYNLGLGVGPSGMAKWAKAYGLDSLTGIDLPYEKKGLVADVQWKKKKLKQIWFPGDTLNFSIGQGFMEITPIEVAVAMSTFANGGYRVTPYLLQSVEGVNAHITTRTYVGSSDKNIEIVKKALRGVVADGEGTARILNKLDMKIHGKTGTAQTSGKSHAWFVGFFPYKNRTYTVCVFLEHGSSSHEAVKVTLQFLKEISQKDFL